MTVRLRLAPTEVALLLADLGLPPGPPSPLCAVWSAPAEPGGRRVNRFAAAILAACARPEEVLWVRTAEGTGFSVCRRGSLHVACTIGPDGQVTVEAPLTRTQVLVALVGALSGDRPEPDPLGFHLRGPATDAVVLRVVVDRCGDRGLARAAVADAVAALLDPPARACALGSLTGVEGLRRLLAGDLTAAVERLLAAGHLTVHDDRLVPSAAARGALGQPLVAALALGRRVVVDGTVLEGELRLLRAGDRLLVLRTVPAEPVPEIDLLECSRAQLRVLVGGFVLLPARPASSHLAGSAA